MGTCKMKFLCLLRVHFIKKRKIGIALHWCSGKRLYHREEWELKTKKTSFIKNCSSFTKPVALTLLYKHRYIGIKI